VSPILVRPVREQLEHDRIIRVLQTKFRRRFDVGINPGMEQNAPVGTGPTAVFPDVVLTSLDRGRKIETVIEVETVESVNNLESLSEWAPYSRLRPAFHLYVPASMADVAKRLCTDSNLSVAEIVSYHWIGDEMRFVSVHKGAPDGRKHVQPAAGPSTKPSTKPSKKPKASKPKPAARKAAQRPKPKPARKTSARSPKRK
jgi:hypothetical protein